MSEPAVDDFVQLLTPDGEPFYCGTYFPPARRGGQPGFGELLAAITQTWEQSRGEVDQIAEQARAHLAQTAAGLPDAGIPVDDDLALLVLFQAVDAADHGRLARAGRAADDQLLTAADLQVDVAQDVELAVPLVHADHLDGGRGVQRIISNTTAYNQYVKHQLSGLWFFLQSFSTS